MRKEKKIESLKVTVKELTVKEIANLLDADEKDIIAMIFGGGDIKKPDFSADDIKKKVEFFCQACVGKSLEGLIKDCFQNEWTPSEMMELWEGFIEVNRPLAGLPKAFGIDGQTVSEILKAFGRPILKDLKAVSPELFEPGMLTPGNTASISS